jgi:hypothetical protein
MHYHTWVMIPFVSFFFERERDLALTTARLDSRYIYDM